MLHVQLSAPAVFRSVVDGQPFDAILADVPCTAAGIVRRHPDIRWFVGSLTFRLPLSYWQVILKALWST